MEFYLFHREPGRSNLVAALILITLKVEFGGFQQKINTLRASTCDYKGKFLIRSFFLMS